MLHVRPAARCVTLVKSQAGHERDVVHVYGAATGLVQELAAHAATNDEAERKARLSFRLRGDFRTGKIRNSRPFRGAVIRDRKDPRWWFLLSPYSSKYWGTIIFGRGEFKNECFFCGLCGNYLETTIRVNAPRQECIKMHLCTMRHNA